MSAPPPPPGFTLDAPPPRKVKPRASSADMPPPPPAGFELDEPEAVDGDTVRDGSRRVRLFGVDAPERNQLGWNRQGQSVPIGQQSRDWLQGSITDTSNARLGDVAGTSYGRLVAPISLDGMDAGKASIRSGNALAAPQFLGSDPKRRFGYMEAERLARLNRLGPMNDTLAQSPANQRRNPDWVPERETIAQFWDTPTPLQGMRPEAEAEYVGLLRSGTPDQIVAFATSQGMGIDPEEVRKWAAWRDGEIAKGKAFQAYPRYERGPDAMIQEGDGTGGAMGRGFSEGFLAGGLGELGAVVDTLGGTGGRENVWNSDRRLADIWANNEYQNASILRGDEFAHPTASTLGEVGGAITSGFVIPYGAGARTVPALAKVGGVYGGAEGFLGTDGGFAERLQGGVIGAPIGAGVNAVGGKALQAAIPALSRGFERAMARLPRKVAAGASTASEAAGEAGLDYTGDNLGGAVNNVANRVDDPWSEFADAPGTANDNPKPKTLAELAEIARQSERSRNDPRAPANDGPIGTPAEIAERQAYYDRHKRDGTATAESLEGYRRYWGLSDTPQGGDAGPGRVQSVIADDIPPPPAGFTMDDPAAPFRIRPVSNDDEPIASGLQDLSAVVRRRAAMGMDGEPGASVSSAPFGFMARRLLDPLNDAERAAAAARVAPRDVLPVPANTVDGVEEASAMDAGRFVPAKAPNERDGLSRGTVRGWNGSPVPKVGPTDLIGWLRLRGGLQDQGGELSHMGFTNAPRRGLEHVGQEARFGPLVNPDGDTLDDAALAAWEAGYFPEFDERPSVNDFLDALRDTYNGGSGRRFLPDDWEELQRYEAMRGERFDLEQQQREAGTVWNDMATDADDAAPFPPVEAYEEWPSDAIKRVGNVDVTKLDTPQDIARALRTSYNAMGGFDAATRGRVTQAETERLASELGMTADDLLSRRKGQALNAEEALAARQILAKSSNELVNLARKIQRMEKPGDEAAAAFQRALVRHAAIQEQVAGATAEAGRALQQFRMMADSRAVPGEVLASIRDAGGGEKGIKDAADFILEAVEGPPGRFNTRVRKAASPRFSDKLAELYINNLLSGPQTHVVNAISNTMTAISQIPENAVASAIGGVRRLAARKEVDRVLAGELGARLFGMVQGTKEGAQLFARALKTGETSDTFSKIAGHDMRAISGLKGEVIRIPGRLLNSADEFFKGVSRRAEINALAYRQAHREGLEGDAIKARVAELSANPTEAIELRGLDFARYMTFQRPLQGMGAKASQLSREFPLLRPIITFVRTPVNLLKFAAERSPIAPALKEWRADFKAGGARRDLALARATLGSGFATIFYQAALEGNVTGGAPTDQAKNRFMRADGWQPYSVRIGDQWVSYSRLDPFAMQLGVAADLALRADGMSAKQLDNYAMLMVASIMEQLADKTWLSGVTDFTSALTDAERYGPGYLRRLGGALVVPNAFAQTARAIDPVTRERKTMAQELQARIPGLSDNLLPKRDIWGQPITNEGGVGPDLLNPFRQSTIKGDPVNAAMLENGVRAGPPSKQHTVEGKKVDWTPEQYDRLQELAGRAAYSGMVELISNPAWEDMSKAERGKAAAKTFKKAREDAKAAVLGLSDPEAPPPPPAGFKGESGSVPPPPPGFAVEGESAGRNVYRELQEKIPGIRLTSGFRDHEYNQSLKRRGYQAADDSTHMDGDTFDALPPPGRSMAWLRAQVVRNWPKAETLIHDGHLHFRVPGYYGAPALGGAKAAGVRNPLAGIPPPPPGFTIQPR